MNRMRVLTVVVRGSRRMEPAYARPTRDRKKRRDKTVVLSISGEDRGIGGGGGGGAGLEPPQKLEAMASQYRAGPVPSFILPSGLVSVECSVGAKSELQVTRRAHK